MRRFNYEDNDDYREDIDKFFNEEEIPDIDEEQLQALMEQEDIQIEFVYRDLNHRLLRTAIRTCEKSFWYWFCSQNTRLKMIEKAYEALKNLEGN